MKRILASCFLVASMFMGLYADPIEDAQFKQFVEKLQKETQKNPSGVIIMADPVYRIVFTVLPIQAKSAEVTPQQIQSMRRDMLTSLRNCKTKEDREILKNIKDLKIRMVFSLITADKNIATFSFSYLDVLDFKISKEDLPDARTISLRLASLTNMKQIGLACKMYSGDFSERFPDKLSLLVTENYNTDPKTYISPLDRRAKPFSGKEIRPGNTSYAYVGKGLTENSSPDLPLAFEKPYLIGKDGLCNVVFVDGSARTIKVRGRTCRAIAAELAAQAPGASAKDKAAVIANAAAVDRGR